MENRKKNMVRCTFELTQDEAAALCAVRCEPKPSTAAAQAVRLLIQQRPGRKPGTGGAR